MKLLFLSDSPIAEAALLFEGGKDLSRSAEMHEHLGNLEKAAQLHLRSGGSARAAALLARSGDFAGAAEIFRNKGDSLRAAQALELSGDKAAAGREFREAGHYERAARLLKEAELFSEAAEIYSLLVKDRNLDPSTVEQYYNYAAFLALAGETVTAAALYSSILRTCGDYRKARGNLRALGHGPEGLPPSPEALSPPPPARPSRPGTAPLQDHPGPPEQPPVPSSPDRLALQEELNDSIVAAGVGEDSFRKTTSLRNIITYGNLEYRYSMRLWIQIMRTLAEKHRENVFYGCLSPDSLSIDMQNKVTIGALQELREPYAAPEVLLGEPPGPHSDIYAMGVILFEMVTGSLEFFRVKRPLEIKSDIPDWLDELVVKCTMKDRRDRYLSTDEVSSALMEVKKSI